MGRPPNPASLPRLRVPLAAVLATLFAATLCAPSAHAQGTCGTDVDRNGTVGASDLSQVLAAWGACSGCAADTNRDGAVDATDLAAVLTNWGGTCTVPTWATVLEYTPNPSVVTSQSLRDAIAAAGRPWRVRMNDIPQIEMLLVPAGSYGMGCSPSIQGGCAADELPVHTVTLAKAFYLGRYEVTQAQWTAVTGLNGSYFSGPNYPDSDSRPVEQVSWIMATNFCAGLGLRLPTEAEWEYAYRAGTTTAYHSMPGAPQGTDDEALSGNIGWSQLNSGNQTHNVGGLAPNGFGFHDMSGNVKEWCSDWYGPYAAGPQTNPTGGSPKSGFRVSRGGSFNLPPYYTRSSKRGFFLPNYQFSWIFGFRVARNP